MPPRSEWLRSLRVWPMRWIAEAIQLTARFSDSPGNSDDKGNFDGSKHSRDGVSKAERA
ncbi:hypothetical protein Mal65_43910 [Crateriforma conspicua]|nr:hypothetical protein Mal65_43910 [Crateriforma conspicua]